MGARIGVDLGGEGEPSQGGTGAKGAGVGEPTVCSLVRTEVKGQRHKMEGNCGIWI